MKLHFWLVLILLLTPCVGFAANKDIVELQRQLALLDDRVRTSQDSVDQRMRDILALLHQTLDQVKEASATDAAMNNSLKELLDHQEQTVAKPVASLDAKVDGMNKETLVAANALADLGARLRRVDEALIELNNLVRVIQSPPPPPPSVSETVGGPPSGVTADGLFQSAIRDRMAGQYAAASSEFRDYLRYFDNTELTAAAQFHIGEIAFAQGDTDAAIKACDAVLDRFPKSGKAPDALYLKARAFGKQGKRSRAVQVLKRVIHDYPGSDAAGNAKAELNRSRP